MVSSMAPRFPLFVDLSKSTCLVVGGGTIATRRVETLKRCGAKVRVVAPAFSEAIVAWAAADADSDSALELVDREFRDRDLDGALLVVACTNQREVNCKIGKLCKEKKIQVSVCDALEESSFFFPGLVTRGELAVGISTNGLSPAVSKQVREVVEMVLPDDFGDRIAKVGRSDKDME